jgi:hypothetical protein
LAVAVDFLAVAVDFLAMVLFVAVFFDGKVPPEADGSGRLPLIGEREGNMTGPATRTLSAVRCATLRALAHAAFR